MQGSSLQKTGESADVDESRLVEGLLRAADLQVQKLVRGTALELACADNGLGHGSGNQEQSRHVGLHYGGLMSIADSGERTYTWRKRMDVLSRHRFMGAICKEAGGRIGMGQRTPIFHHPQDPPKSRVSPDSSPIEEQEVHRLLGQLLDILLPFGASRRPLRCVPRWTPPQLFTGMPHAEGKAEEAVAKAGSSQRLCNDKLMCRRVSIRKPATVPEPYGQVAFATTTRIGVSQDDASIVADCQTKANEHIPRAQGIPVQPVARATDDISSCGNAWMPREDVTIGGGTDTRRGFNSAVRIFCSKVNGLTVEAGGYLSMTTEVFLNGGRNPSTYGVVGFVDFEVHNKIKQDHQISESSCITYLQALSKPGGKCSGEVNADTKGGTWQVGNNAISYHALGNKVPPKQDAVNKLYRGGALETQSVNKRNGAALNPWPFSSADSVKPTTCHSHNDYDRDMPLWAAMSAGCIAFEADVWYVRGELLVGHILPGIGRTLRAQYIEPLRAILDHNNGGAPGTQGLYPASPSQGVVLMIDFKTSDPRTLDTVSAALQPLRDGGYLSRVEGGRFVERQVTVVASGSASYDRINAGDGVPDRDVFYDAKVDAWSSKYTTANSYYASADFQDAVGSPGSVAGFTAAQKDKVRAQVQNAHAAGLKVRYYNLPGEYMWEPLLDLGVDRLNADDMSNTARLPRI
ncbi:hypothetical protein NLU13_8073 [Sarocladium strictum]|uniref:Altered inheritance of mitochondria protein 6 n=1 Tax=Sarocladium strictum TaxID=5046 RepID=A0AA39GBL7_SARSR|nr:hypothetical protein NLU13_8073 [Sarocladium strictum]